MSQQWHYSQDGAQYGPVDEAEIIRLIQDGELAPGSPVLKVGSMDWQPARNHACFQVEIYPKKKASVQASAVTSSGGTSHSPKKTAAQPAATSSPAVTTVVVKEKSALPWVLFGVAVLMLVGVLLSMEQGSDEPPSQQVVTVINNPPPNPPPATNRPSILQTPAADPQLAPTPTSTPATQADEKGFKSIFNGKDLNGWAGPIQNYQAVDGTLQCKPGKGGTIYTKEVYGDFVVQLEIKLPAGSNNGLAIRYPGKGDPAYVGMCELQVLDNTSPKYAKLHPAQFHGSVYGMFAAKRGHLKKPGEWNYQEVTVKGSTIKVVLNDEMILDCDLSKVEKPMYKIGKFKGRTRTKGHFGFAGHGAGGAVSQCEHQAA